MVWLSEPPSSNPSSGAGVGFDVAARQHSNIPSWHSIGSRSSEGVSMARIKKGTEYICGVCGTTLIVSEEGYGVLEDVVCCEKPMETRTTKPKKKIKAKHKKQAKK
jgi:hypothetical protein